MNHSNTVKITRQRPQKRYDDESLTATKKFKIKRNMNRSTRDLKRSQETK
jgi:hypothetical protein